MNKGIFSFLREESSIDDIYDVGPWAADDETRYLEPNLDERLHHEIIDIQRWLEPTEAERRIRLSVITRFTNMIEKYYHDQQQLDVVVIPQGSSATNTCLPVSDIDLIILNLPSEKVEDISQILRTLTKLFLKSKMISNYKIIDHASVPIVKLTERPFGFSIDICASNINGALNITRVRNTIQTYSPNFKPVLMFLKLLIFAHKIDDPSNGGFGSNQLINLVLFAFQSRPDLAKNAGQMVMYILDVLANKLNYFLVGVSTVEGGNLFSKRKLDLISPSCPQSFLFEDPQFRDNFFGVRTSHSLNLVTICRTALHAIAVHDFVKRSTVTTFLPDIDSLIDRRCELERFGRLFDKSLYEFSRTTDEIPTYIPRGKHPLPPFLQREMDTKPYDPKKTQMLKDKKRQKSEQRKQQILQNQIKKMRDQEEKSAKKKKGQKHFKPQTSSNRGHSPARYRK